MKKYKVFYTTGVGGNVTVVEVPGDDVLDAIHAIVVMDIGVDRIISIVEV